MDVLSILLAPYRMNRINTIIDRCRGKSVLDVGFCDVNSEPTKTIRKTAKAWIGIDPSAPNTTTTIRCLFENVKLEERFDIVLLGEVLEHTDNLGVMIENAKHHLNEQGVILFSTPNPLWWVRGVFIAFYPLIYRLGWGGLVKPINPEHVLWLDEATMECLARRHSLEIRWLGKPWWPSIIGEMK